MAVVASIKKGFGVTKQSLSIVGLMSLFGLVWNLLNLYYGPKIQAQVQAPSLKVSVIIIIATLVFILLSIFLQAGSLGYVRDRLKQGKADLSVFMASGSKYYFRLLLVGLIVMVVVILCVVAAAAAVALLRKPGLIIAVPVALVAVYTVLLMFFASYMVVLDEKKAMESIKNSVTLVGKGTHFFFGVVLTAISPLLAIACLIPSFRNSKLGQKNLVKIFAVTAVVVSIGFAIGLLTGVILGLLNVAVPGVFSQVVYAVLSSVLNAFLGIFVTATFMHFYLEISNTNTTGA